LQLSNADSRMVHLQLRRRRGLSRRSHGRARVTGCASVRTGLYPAEFSTSKKYVIETMCGGVALFDYNNDGLLDVFFVNGGHLDDPVKCPARFSRRDPAYWNRLYRQNKDGQFIDVTEKAGLHREADTNYGMGVATGDYDNDGFTDLYVTKLRPQCALSQQRRWNVYGCDRQNRSGGGGWSVAAGFFDYDNDGRLDLFVTRYLEYDLCHAILCAGRFPYFAHPACSPGLPTFCITTTGDGTFY